MTNSATQLTAQEREIRAQYFREWRARNKEKVKLYNQRYWRKKTAQKKEADNAAKDI